MSEQMIQFINAFVLGVLGLAIITALLKWIRSAIDPVIKRAMTAEQWNFLRSLAETAVKYAEQTGVLKEGREKLDAAITYIESTLVGTSLEGLDLHIITGLIESAVHDMNDGGIILTSTTKEEEATTR